MAEPKAASRKPRFVRKSGARTPNVAQSLNDLAMLYSEQRLYEQAEPLLKRALAIREKALGAEHPDTASSRANYADY